MQENPVKSPLASVITLAEFCCGKMGTKILYGSNDYDQADLLFMATDAMREASPKLAKFTRRNQKGIFFGNIKQKSHVGKFTSQNKGSIRKMSARTSAKEGRNIKVGVVDMQIYFRKFENNIPVFYVILEQ